MTTTYDKFVTLKQQIINLKEDKSELQKDLDNLKYLIKMDLIKVLNSPEPMRTLLYFKINNLSLYKDNTLIIEYQDCRIVVYLTKGYRDSYNYIRGGGMLYSDIYFHSNDIGNFRVFSDDFVFENEIHGELFRSWFKKNEKELTQLFRNKVYIPIDHISAKIEKLDSQISDLKIQIKDLEGGVF